MRTADGLSPFRAKSASGILRLIALFLGALALLQSVQAAHVRVTTWNLDWFPDGSPKGAPVEKQERRIREAADVLRELNPDIILLQEIRDYQTCVRLADAIRPNTYTVAMQGTDCSNNFLGAPVAVKLNVQTTPQ